MKTRAVSWSSTQIGSRFESFAARRSLSTLTSLTASHADLIGARADTLLRQVRGDDRRELPLSVMLRETSLPAFLRQFVWNESAGALTGFDAVDEETARDRVRAIERIYSDQHWSNINTVYASGEGTVRMALVKDDIGNWNLKSFDQDPTDILAANTKVGLAALDAAAQVAKTAAGAGGAAAAGQAFAIARMATGGAPGGAPTVGGQNLAQVRADLIARLVKLRADTELELKALNDKLAADDAKGSAYLTLKQKFEDAAHDESTARRAPTFDYPDKRDALEAARAAFAPVDRAHRETAARREAFAATTRARVQEMLNGHEAVVEALDRAATSAGAAARALSATTVPASVLPSRATIPPIKAP